MRTIAVRFTHSDEELSGADAIVDDPSGLMVEVAGDELCVSVKTVGD